MSEKRKSDHIALTAKAQISSTLQDARFHYEPLFGRHPSPGERVKRNFLGTNFDAPIWISSMTGGTEAARHINQNLARAVKDFNLGMGLGSCRPLLEEKPDRFEDFNLRPLLGDRPFYANLGIAQLEKALSHGTHGLDPIHRMVERLKANGLIIHINPLQEWVQPEGDRLLRTPLEVLEEFIPKAKYPLMVKEVGQGLGPKSLEALINLPLIALEFGALGGTNFTEMERLRSGAKDSNPWKSLSFVGHTALQMVNHLNKLWTLKPNNAKCQEFIISGGISTFLEGFYLVKKCCPNAIYGQASGLLSKAQGPYEDLAKFIEQQIQGFIVAEQFLEIGD